MWLLAIDVVRIRCWKKTCENDRVDLCEMRRLWRVYGCAGVLESEIEREREREIEDEDEEWIDFEDDETMEFSDDEEREGECGPRPEHAIAEIDPEVLEEGFQVWNTVHSKKMRTEKGKMCMKRLVRGGYTYRERMSEIRQHVEEVFGGSLEDFVEELIEMDKKVYRVVDAWKGATTSLEVKTWVKKNQLNGAATLDLCYQCDLTDDQLKKIRFGLFYKRKEFENLFACERTVGTLRRKEVDEVMVKLNRQVVAVKSKEGVYLDLKLVMEFALQHYGGQWDETEIFPWKVSMDGKVTEKCGGGKREMVLMGIVPIGLPDIKVQSSHAVFPTLFSCGNEESVQTEPGLQSFWENSSKVIADEKITVEDENGQKRIHQYKFIVVCDLAACYKMYKLPVGSCPYCDCTKNERHKMELEWATWSRSDHEQRMCPLKTTLKQFVMDTLHALMRIMSHCVEIIYFKLKGKTRQVQFVKVMCEDLEVGFETYKKGQGQEGERIKSYGGKMCRKILENIEKLCPLFLDAKKVHPPHRQRRRTRGQETPQRRKDEADFKMMWQNFRVLFNELESGIMQDDWPTRSRQWGKNMVYFFGVEAIRIYPHIFIYHGYDLVQRFGGLKKLCLQGFENTNCLHNYDAMRHSSKQIEIGKKRKLSKTGTTIITKSDAMTQVFVSISSSL